MRAVGCIEGGPLGPGGAIPMGEYFSGVGDDAVVPPPGTIVDTSNSWKGPWFFGLFVGVVVGISMGKLLK